jgi:hypothetical protein
MSQPQQPAGNRPAHQQANHSKPPVKVAAKAARKEAKTVAKEFGKALRKDANSTIARYAKTQSPQQKVYTKMYRPVKERELLAYLIAPREFKPVHLPDPYSGGNISLANPFHVQEIEWSDSDDASPNYFFYAFRDPLRNIIHTAFLEYGTAQAYVSDPVPVPDNGYWGPLRYPYKPEGIHGPAIYPGHSAGHFYYLATLGCVMNIQVTSTAVVGSAQATARTALAKYYSKRSAADESAAEILNAITSTTGRKIKVPRDIAKDLSLAAGVSTVFFQRYSDTDGYVVTVDENGLAQFVVPGETTTAPYWSAQAIGPDSFASSGTLTIGYQQPDLIHPLLAQKALLYFVDQASSISSIRIPAISILYMNTSQEITKNGQVAAYQAPGASDFWDYTSYESIARANSACSLHAATGLFAYLKITNTQDVQFLPTEYDGQVSFDLDIESDFLAACINVPQSGGRAGQIYHSFGVEFKTDSTWYRKTPTHVDTIVFETAINNMAQFPQFHENPLHLKDIKEFLGSAMNKVLQYGPTILKGAGMLAALL